MVWFKVDDSFPTHPKVLRIPRRDRIAAIGLWTLAGGWCAHNLTDGHLDAAMLDEFAASKKHADLLVKVGLWETTDAGYVFHDWADWQPTAAEVTAKREEEAERKRRWREQKAAERAARHTPVPLSVPAGHLPDATRDTHVSPPSVLPSVRPESALPVPDPHPYPTRTRPDVPSGDVEVGLLQGGSGTEADAHASNEPPLCRRHIGQDRSAIPPCDPCRRLREAWEATRPADAGPPPLPPLCGDCDNRWIQPDDDGPAYHCPRCHPAALALIGA